MKRKKQTEQNIGWTLAGVNLILAWLQGTQGHTGLVLLHLVVVTILAWTLINDKEEK